MAIEFALAVYDSIEGAELAYGRARGSGVDAPWLSELAFVEMHHNGRIAMRGMFGDRFADIDEIGEIGVAAVGLGALTGALVGSLFGPAGFTVGIVVGGAAGGRKAAEDEPLPHSRLLEELRGDLKQGTSALILLAETTHVDGMLEMLDVDSDHVIRRELSDDEVAALVNSIANVPAAKPGEFT